MHAVTLPRRLVLALAVAALPAGAARADSPALCDRQFKGDIAELYERLKSSPGAAVVASRNPDFDVIAVEPQGDMWNFTRPTHPAHPSVACRRLVQEGGAFRVRTEIRCGAAKPRCDKLAADYDALDREMTEAIRRKAPGR